MFRLRTDEDVHVDVLDRGVLRVRRMTKGDLRWEHSLDLTGVYADRFEDPLAETIDGWFGAAGELRLIVHVRDIANPRLLPPRELTFAADAPRLERSRPCSDRYTFGSAPLRSHVWGGTTFSIVQELDDHVLAVTEAAEGHRLGWSIADQPRIGFRWLERSEVGNLAPPSGACSTCTTVGRFAAEQLPGMNPIGVDRERGELRRTVECHRCLTTWQVAEVREPGTLEQLWKWTRVGQRERGNPPIPSATIPAPSNPTQAIANRPLVSSALKRGHVSVAGCDHDEGFEVVNESPDLIELWLYNDAAPRPDLAAAGWHESASSDIYTYRQTFEKADPRLGGFVGLVEHAGYRLRFVERRAGEVRVLASRTHAALLGLDQDKDTGHGWVPDRGDAPPRPVLDQVLIDSLASFNQVMYAPLARTFRVTNESADTLSIRVDSQSLDVLKLDGRIVGPFSRWVSHRGNILRVIAERSGHVLAIAHPKLGRTLGFAEMRPMGAVIEQSCRWIPLAEVEAASPPTIHPA